MKLLRLVLLLTSVAMLTQCNKTPDLTFSNIEYIADGEIQKIETGGGKKTVVHFYASWCGDCKREMPDANKMLSEAPDDIRIYYLTDDTPERMAAMNKKFGIPFDTYQVNQSLKNVGVHYIPLTYFINENGKSEFAEAEQIDWHSDRIKKFLGYTK